MLIVVNNGVFEFVQIIAPHEDWSYMDASHRQVYHLDNCVKFSIGKVLIFSTL